MYLSKIRIKNYRAIREASLTCEDGITVLIGENGCGKSSILNALEACLGRKLKGDNFDIKSSDFFNDFELNTQADRMEIELFFSKGEITAAAGNAERTMDGGGFTEQNKTQAIGELNGNTEKIIALTSQVIKSTSKLSEDMSSLTEAASGLVDSAAEQADKVAKLAEATADLVEQTTKLAKSISGKGTVSKNKADAVFLRHSELLHEGQPEFSLMLCGQRHADNGVTVDYKFLNSQGKEVLADKKSKLLAELRHFCPFIRIRASVLQPPVFDDFDISAMDDDKERSRKQVERIMMQAYGDLLREADYSAEQNLRRNSTVINYFYEELNSMFRHTNPDVKERVSAPLSPLNSWLHYVSMLRGSGARSVAMLYFAGAYFNAIGSEAISKDLRPILSIEYPEANLHPLMLTSLWNLIDRMPTQMLVTTYCVELLSAIPFRSLRRIVRSSAGDMRTFQVPVEKVNMDDMRRIAYHLRVRRGTALFMRVWMLVEGETEYWLLPEIARSMGFDLWQEGIEFIEFAQCGLEPLVRLANYLGISWFLLCDGDKAGQAYSEKAEKFAKASNGLGHVVRLSSVDIEHSFWDNGYAEVFVEASGIAKESIAQSPQHQLAINANKKNLAKTRAKALEKSREVIKRAVKKVSKPGMALLLGKAVVESGLGIPSDIEKFIFNAVRVARETGGGDGSLMENCKPTLPDYPADYEAAASTYEVASTPFAISDTPIDWKYDFAEAEQNKGGDMPASDADTEQACENLEEGAE